MALLATKERRQTQAIDRIVRCTRTQRYLAGSTWTEVPDYATVFADELAAVRACVENELQDVELVLWNPATHVELFSTPIR